MSFSTELAKLVTDQLSRLVTLKSYQLAGQVANLDFWLSHVRNALATIDGYGVRFVRMNGGQEQYIATHGPPEFTHKDDWHTTTEKVIAPRRVPDRELRKARRELMESVIRFLKCCHQEGLLTDSQHSTYCTEFRI